LPFKTFAILVVIVCFAPLVGRAGWLDLLNPKSGSNTTGSAAVPTTLAALSQSDVAGGLKEALSKGVNQAIANLGKEGVTGPLFSSQGLC